MRNVWVIMLFLKFSIAYANTAIETETAQLGEKGEITFSQSLEYAKGVDGHSFGTATQFEYAITDRSEILIEPFFHIWEFPSDPTLHKADGPGDLEITPSYMIIEENKGVPALVLAFKLKVPTGAPNVGGSEKFDYFPYLILGQHYEGFTFNANLGVNFVTPEGGGALEHTFVWDLEAEREIAKNWILFLEVYNSEEDINTVSTALQYQFAKHSNAFIALGYDDESTLIVRPGFNLEF